MQNFCSSHLACCAPHITGQLHSLLLSDHSLASWLSSLLLASADTMNFTTQMSLSFVLLPGLVHDYASMSIILGYSSPQIWFLHSAIAKTRLVAFSLFLHKNSFILQPWGKDFFFFLKKSNLNVYLIVGKELAPMKMLAEVSAAKHNSFYKSARKPGGRWQFLNNSQLHFLGKYLLMCPDNNVLWKCVCTMSLTKASLLTWTQLGTALEQCLTHKLLSSSNNKITSRIQLWTKQPSQITFTWGEKKKVS